MRWLTFYDDGAWIPAAMAADGSVVDLHEASRLAGQAGPADMLELIRRPEDGDRLRELTGSAPPQARRRREQIRLGPPVPRPGKLLCLAGNYREHIVESGFAAVDEQDVITPQMFLKPATCLTGDGAEVTLSAANVRVGWEAELAVVIGRTARRVRAEAAMDHVFGYTILNDLSERALNSRLQGRRLRERDPFFDWLAGKWFDGFAPCGPWIVTADEIPDPDALGIRLSVNGELRQQGRTSDMIFDVAAVISAASAIMTLEPGDIIATGTPAGAGIGGRESYLRPGDEVVCEIDRIGTLRSTIARPA
jgi:2-keto-4-pentenoate hydratase/2-oxohepta-3-ene-1,7-dioic acid hydratase in catechol pathway